MCVSNNDTLKIVAVIVFTSHHFVLKEAAKGLSKAFGHHFCCFLCSLCSRLCRLEILLIYVIELLRR